MQARCTPIESLQNPTSSLRQRLLIYLVLVECLAFNELYHDFPHKFTSSYKLLIFQTQIDIIFRKYKKLQVA